jgi:hypothetical protein
MIAGIALGSVAALLIGVIVQGEAPAQRQSRLKPLPKGDDKGVV